MNICRECDKVLSFQDQWCPRCNYYIDQFGYRSHWAGPAGTEPPKVKDDDGSYEAMDDDSGAGRDDSASENPSTPETATGDADLGFDGTGYIQSGEGEDWLPQNSEVAEEVGQGIAGSIETPSET